MAWRAGCAMLPRPRQRLIRQAVRRPHIETRCPLMVSSTQPVLVVGAGPVGLVAAAELARRGTPVRIIDKLMSPTTESRAIVARARSLEMLDRMGLVQQVIDPGVPTTAMEMHASGRRLARLEFDRVDSPFPGCRLAR
jgi:2-polyprenyl-6-methoxyphenol hydroxylase-like FAD-dependent oxidoreductase